jgi:hypothetical protein
MTTPHAALRAIYEGRVSIIREFRGGSRLDAPEGVTAESVMRICALGFAARCDPESVGAYSVSRIALTPAGIEALEVIEDRQS